MNAHNASYNLGYASVPEGHRWGNGTDGTGFRLGWPAAVPSGVAGYAVGCQIWVAGVPYINTGTYASCTFTPIAVSGATTGTIPLPLHNFRKVASNEIPAIAVASGNGGTLAVDSDPQLQRVNAATDKALRIEWESGSVLEITQQFIYPLDLDPAADVVVNLFAGMKAASVDVPVLTVGFFEGIGDTNAGGNTAALSTTAAWKTVTIAAADIGAAPNFGVISIVPGAHATASNDVYLYAAFLSYTRKLVP